MSRSILVATAALLLACRTLCADPAGYTPPQVLTKGEVHYPEVARLNRIQGVVRIKFAIDETGHVTDAWVVGSSQSVTLDDAVHEHGVREWVFKPAMLDGKAVPSTYEQEFEFKLDPAEERAIALRRLALPIGLPDPPYPPEAVPRRLEGRTTISVHWTQGEHPGLVDTIYLVKSSGSGLLDVTALRWAYENWHADPSLITREAFTKTVVFQPPLANP